MASNNAISMHDEFVVFYDMSCKATATPSSTHVTFNSYTMGTSDFPDIYTRSWLSGFGYIYIGQTMNAHGITNNIPINVWANQYNYSLMASLYLYGDLLDCIVGLNLMIKTFL